MKNDFESTKIVLQEYMMIKLCGVYIALQYKPSVSTKLILLPIVNHAYPNSQISHGIKIIVILAWCMYIWPTLCTLLGSDAYVTIRFFFILIRDEMHICHVHLSCRNQYMFKSGSKTMTQSNVIYQHSNINKNSNHQMKPVLPTKVHEGWQHWTKWVRM